MSGIKSGATAPGHKSITVGKAVVYTAGNPNGHHEGATLALPDADADMLVAAGLASHAGAAPAGTSPARLLATAPDGAKPVTLLGAEVGGKPVTVPAGGAAAPLAAAHPVATPSVATPPTAGHPASAPVAAGSGAMPAGAAAMFADSAHGGPPASPPVAKP